MKEKEITQNLIDNLINTTINNNKTSNNSINMSDDKIEEFNGIALELSIVHSDDYYLEFDLQVKNTTNESFLFYYPIPFEEEIIFRNIGTKEIIRPTWPILASGENNGIVIQPNRQIAIGLQKIYFNETTNDGLPNIEIILPKGKYEIFIKTKMDSDFFDPFSHLRYNECMKKSKNNGIKLWQGIAISNICKYEKIA